MTLGSSSDWLWLVSHNNKNNKTEVVGLSSYQGISCMCVYVCFFDVTANELCLQLWGISSIFRSPECGHAQTRPFVTLRTVKSASADWLIVCRLHCQLKCDIISADHSLNKAITSAQWLNTDKEIETRYRSFSSFLIFTAIILQSLLIYTRLPRPQLPLALKRRCTWKAFAHVTGHLT